MTQCWYRTTTNKIELVVNDVIMATMISEAGAQCLLEEGHSGPHNITGGPYDLTLKL